MANVGELDRVRRFLREHPDLHRQRSWACGTTACVAGWTVALAQGVRAGQDVEQLMWQPRCSQLMWQPRCSEQRPHKLVHIGRTVAADAADLLELTEDEACALFESIKTEVRALELLDAIIAREKGELTDEQRTLLDGHFLPTQLATP